MSIISGGGAVVGAGAAGGYQIERSLRFNSADSAYLNRTPASAGNRQTWTFSFWTKRSTLGAEQRILFSNDNGLAHATIEFTSGDAVAFADYTDPSPTYELTTTQLFRDVSAWYHIVAVFDTTNATSGDRMRLYVNGLRVTAFGTANYPTQNFDGYTNNNVPHGIGARIASPVGQYFNGYLTEIYMIDGSALDPTSFGEFNEDTGVWQPKAYSGSYGTNGFYLNFSDNTSTTTLGEDQAGSNDWTTNNFSVTAGAGNDSLVDTPTPYGTDTGVGGEVRGNYATLNPLDSALTGLNNGNLNSGTSGAANWKHCRSTFAMSTGKWYWECLVSGAPDGSNGYQTGVLTGSASLTANPTSASTGFYTRQSTNKYANGTLTNPYFTSTTSNDVLMFAFDADAGKMWNGKNGTWEVSGDPAAGTSENWASVPAGVFPMAGSYGSSLNVTVNFGQRPFAYTAPSGFKALCTQNLPDPTIVDGGEYFNTVLYSGNSSAQSITGVGFQPDWIWIKSRSNGALNHALFDVLRGTPRLDSATTVAEGEFNQLNTYDADGFTLKNEVTVNGTGNTYVAWNWKANGSGVSNTDGTITSTVSANTDSGFSIVTYTGTGSAATVGHGLGAVPRMIIVKNRDQADAWQVYHAANTANPETDYLVLNTTAATADAADRWNDTLPTSTVFSIGDGVEVNTNTENYVAYVFAAIPGYSAFGSYTGNGSADGPFVYTGFRPAFLLVKSTSTGFWVLLDSARDTYNVVGNELYPNVSNAEATGNADVDFLSNGFKCRRSDFSGNISGETIIYMAFAENPFKISLAR
jgi:hypothetical protein